jgi:hypothetical protein
MSNLVQFKNSLSHYLDCGAIDGIRQTVASIDFAANCPVRIIATLMLAMEAQIVANNFHLKNGIF